MSGAKSSSAANLVCIDQLDLAVMGMLDGNVGGWLDATSFECV